MIVRLVDGRLQLITQPDHARLARRIMEHCVPLNARARRNTILHAIAEHDNGWTETDAAPVVNPDNGRIADFIHAPLGIRQGVWPRGVARLSNDPIAAALVAHHARTVYDRFRSDPGWTAFFSDMEAARDRLLRATGVTLDDLVSDYAFLRLGDLISLAFCTGSTDVQRFRDWSIQLVGARVVVTPDVFDGAVIPIEVNAKTMPNRSFGTDEEARAALSAADTITLSGDVAAVTCSRRESA